MNMHMRAILYALVLALVALVSGVVSADDQHPVRVEVRQQDGAWQLLRGGQSYFIQGGGGRGSLKVLVAAGGNSGRPWGVDRVGPLLDEAQALGVTTTDGIWLAPPRHPPAYRHASAEG